MVRRAVWLIVFGLLVAGAVATAFVNRSPLSSRPRARNMFQAEAADVPGRQRLFDLLQPVRITNCELKRFGERNDGGYVLCGNLLSAVRSGYSYGVAGYDGWGCQVSRTLRVPVHQYDCFDTRQPSCPGGKPIFHAECVGPTTATIDGRPFDSIERQVLRNGDAGKHLVVKIDVEGAEWESFLAAPDALLDRIDQMAVEFHGAGDQKFVAAMEKLRRFFHVAHLHYNNFSCQQGLDPFPAWAYEVLLVNKRIGETDGSPAGIGVPLVDAPNDPRSADCQTTTR
jgi:hypothetical protein